MTAEQESHLYGLQAAGDHTMPELAELFSVGRSTVYRAIERVEQKAVSADGFGQ